MPKCKNCGEKFEPKFSSLEKYCWNSDCKFVDAMEKLKKHKIQESKNWHERKKIMVDNLKTTPNLSHYKNELQIIFNKYIRLRDLGKKCISCETILTKQIKYDAGHFFSVGGYGNLRFEPTNVHGQCVHCNQHLGSNPHEYRIGIEQRIGTDELMRLESIRHEKRQYMKHELIELIEQYKEIVKRIEKFL